MNTSSAQLFHPKTSYFAGWRGALGGLCLLALLQPAFAARVVPPNLVNGLDKILENRLIETGVITTIPENPATTPAKPKLGAGKPAAITAVVNTAAFSAYRMQVAKVAATYDSIALKENNTGKYLVEVMPNGRVPLATLQASLQASFPSLSVTSLDNNYAGHGAIEGYIDLTDAGKIATTSGVSSVILQLRPVHSVGLVTSQGVNQHRVNRINTTYNAAAPVNYDGTGMSIGVMSDSYNSRPSAEGGFTYAEADVASGDLPGTGNLTNSQPVVVLQDYNPTPGATNEGRGMCQIVADMAPQARIGFATADVGEIGFANNIRALGGLAGYTYPAATQQGFKGDVVCDDVSYLDEPIFQDGIVAQGVIDVVNAGVTYCSSAANNWGTDGYSSVFRPVPNGSGLTSATNSALVGTNLNLAGVDPALYAGGFHNFNPAAGQQDVAQLFNSASDPQGAVFQWNDPYDTSAPNLINPPLFEGDGTSTAGSEMTFGPFPFTAGHLYVIAETVTSGDFDGIVRVTNSDTGKVLVDQDTGTDETVTFYAPTTNNYTVTVHPFGAMPPVYTSGTYHLKINQGTNVSGITQDFNLLFFKTDGTFISAVATNNFATNRPYELFVPTLSSTASQVQLVISRSNATAPANAANQLKYVFFGNGASGIGPAEYNSYLTPVTFGHSAAAGANSVAAYSMFRPNLPEDFTSPGPVTIYFDTNNNRLATPQLRLKPDIAAADGANNTFFPLGPGNDYPFDPDNFSNFYGTSAASPHSAAIAALVIQAHGGSGSLTPAQVKMLLQTNAFPHDLDPYAVNGTASAHGGTVNINVVSDNDMNTGTGSNNPNTWTVNYTGPGYVKDLHFNPEGTAATGGNVSGGNFNGFMPADFMNAALYKFTPGMVFNTNLYTAGTQSDFATTPTFTNPAPAPSTNAFYWTLNFAFPANTFTSGKNFRYNIGRYQQQDANVPQGMTIPNLLYGQPNQYSADILGSGILIPEYADNPTIMPGMTFSGNITDGGIDYPFTGRLTNNVGKGYSPLDGYGFVNAQAATTGTLPVISVVSRKVHGTAGTFDLPLPITGTIGVECRNPGASNSFQLIYTYDRMLSSTGSASVTQGTATVASTTLGPEGNQVTVNLTGVTNAQHLMVTLSNSLDSVGGALSAIPARMDVLLGDVSANGRTDSGDTTIVRQLTITTPTQSTFRSDVDESGRIDVGDVTIVRNSSITGLP